MLRVAQALMALNWNCYDILNAQNLEGCKGCVLIYFGNKFILHTLLCLITAFTDIYIVNNTFC